MTPELEHALKRHTQWFGSYKASGELKKIQVWLVVNGGQIEFLTPRNSYKIVRDVGSQEIYALDWQAL